MLPPEEFGNYLAVGSEKRSRGQAIFFEVDPALKSSYFPLANVASRCVPHEDGKPRKSTYISIYRVLEHLPVSALGKMYLTTDDGRVLGISREAYKPETSEGRLHMYQEFCPVTPRVVSKLAPHEFSKTITDQTQPVSVPRIVFAELKLEGMATNPDSSDIRTLPYPNLDHLRDCLRELTNRYAKPTKTVVRQMAQDVLYRTVRGGFYVGDQQDFAYYPMPSKEQLETVYYSWWRSALSSFGG